MDAILLKTKLTTDPYDIIIARIDKNGMLIYEGFCENLGFKTVRNNNNKSCVNIYYSFSS